MTGVRTNVITSVELSGGYSHDTNYFKPLVASTAERFTIRDVTADKAYVSKSNFAAVDEAGGSAYIAFKDHIPAYQGVLPAVLAFGHPVPADAVSFRLPAGHVPLALPPAEQRRDDVLE